MKKLLCLLIIYFPLLIIAQDENKGIHFETGLTWKQLLTKAKAENKFIFVDCYATWCVPCKKMDKEVYPNDTVGNYVNEIFISVKAQMDTSKKDVEEIQQWYADAHSIQAGYKVFAFPTYLFFSPAGEIVHKDLGAKTVKDFISVASDAINPNKQYFTLLNKYQQGKKDYNVVPYLANTAKLFNEVGLALEIATDYMHNYLEKLSDAEFCTKANFDFIGSFSNIVNSKDKVFSLYYNHANKVDSIMGDKTYSSRFVDYVITKEEITPILTIAKQGSLDPDWKKISKTIKYKYSSDYASRNILNAKPAFYKYKKDWKNYTKYLVEQVEKTGIEKVSRDIWGAFYLNNNAWAVFQYSKDKTELKKALSWSELAVQIDSSNSDLSDVAVGNLDTKANLLYKLGRKREAIELEEKAVKMNEEHAAKDKRAPNNDLLKTVGKMKKGEKTWE